MFSKFTINSVVLLALTVFSVAVAAIYRNPLVVYTAVFLVVTNIALFTWAQLSVAGLTIRRRHPRFGVATQPTEITIELVNERRSPRYGTLGFDVHAQLTPGQDYTPVAFLDAPPQQPVLADYTLVPQRRGVFRIGPFYLYGGDPFGFYKCWSRREQYSDLTVLPCPVAFSFRRPASISQLKQDEVETVPLSGDSTEFLGVRDYVEGEPLKRVHWRTSARIGRLISRQYELNVAASLSALVLVDEPMLTGTRVDSPLEYSLTMVASLGYATVSENFHFNYLAVMGDQHDICAGTGRGFYEELAVRLANLNQLGPVDWESQGRVVLNYLPAGSHLIVFTADLGGKTRERLRQLATRFRGLTAVTFNLDSFKHARASQHAGPQLVLGEGYLVLEVSYRDELSAVLAQCLSAPAMIGRQRWA